MSSSDRTWTCPSCTRPSASDKRAMVDAQAQATVTREQLLAALRFGAAHSQGCSFSKPQIDAALIQIEAGARHDERTLFEMRSLLDEHARNRAELNAARTELSLTRARFARLWWIACAIFCHDVLLAAVLVACALLW